MLRYLNPRSFFQGSKDAGNAKNPWLNNAALARLECVLSTSPDPSPEIRRGSRPGPPLCRAEEEQQRM
ncbi:MAG TPA: hypothetical protein PLY73_11410, partial [Candidatus Ozemobacteraceae bacterium]|nr:hypothetical protein [Candidatus Ozemobacteraceae bacterium]